MAKVESVKDLPEWFDLEKYSGCEGFGAVEWFEQLSQRGYLITLQEIRRNNPALIETVGATFTKAAKYIFGVNVESARIPDYFGEGGVERHLADEKRCVHPLTFRHLLEHAQNMERFHSYEPRQWFEVMASGCNYVGQSPHTEDSPMFITSRITGLSEQFAVARIDLSAPDALILESFADCLAELRAAKGRSQAKRFYRPDFKRWKRYGLLPYLDLVIWAMETKNHIPDRVMSAAISRYDAGEANLRKTVAPLAESLMNDLSALQALAALDLAREPAGTETFEP